MTWPTTSSTARGYDWQWRKLRERVLARDSYLCLSCLQKGRLTPATEVDHVVPKSAGGSDHMDNLASTCTPCHKDKSLRDKGITPRKRIGLSGWPEDD